MKTYCYCGMVPGYSGDFLPEPALQHAMLRNIYKDAVIVEEAAVTYTNAEGELKMEYRSALNWLIRGAEKEDVVVFFRACLMGDDAEQCMEVYKTLYSRGVDLVFLKEPYLNSSIYRESMGVLSGMDGDDDYMDAVICAYIFEVIRHQIDVSLSKEVFQERSARIRAGMEKARLAGNVPGLKKGTVLHTKKEEECIPFIFMRSESFGGTMPDMELMSRLGISRNTLYKYKRIVREQIEQEKRELEEERRAWEEEYGERPSIYE